MVTTTTATEKTTITTVEHGEHCSRHIGFIHLAEPDRNICTYNRPLSGEESEREGDGRSGREGGTERGSGVVGGPNKLGGGGSCAAVVVGSCLRRAGRPQTAQPATATPPW